MTDDNIVKLISYMVRIARLENRIMEWSELVPIFGLSTDDAIKYGNLGAKMANEEVTLYELGAYSRINSGSKYV